MAKQSINTLKGWFKKGLKPLESQFGDWLDSFWHKDDNIPMNNVQDLQNVLNSLATTDALAAMALTLNTIMRGVIRSRGDYDASTNLFPETGGSGLNGAIEWGNQFQLSVAGTLDGELYPVGTTIQARIDAPGQDGNNWIIKT